MPKLSIEQIEAALRERKIAPATIIQIITDLEAAAQADKDAKEPTKKAKNQLVVIAIDKDQQIKEPIVALVAQIEDGAPPAAALERILEAARVHNASSRGSRKPVSSLGQAVEGVSRKLFKEQRVMLKTKFPVLVIPTVNTIR